MNTKPGNGFTLVEVLVVVGIIATILALVLPAVMRVRDAASAIESSNNMRQLMIAVQHFESDYRKLPKIRSAHGSLYRAILPYLESGEVFDSIAQNNQVNGSDFYIRSFVSPSDPTQSPIRNGYCSYAANAQVFTTKRKLSSGIRDGLTQTIAFAEHYSFDLQFNGQHTHFSWFLEHLDLTVLPSLTILVKPATFAENGPSVAPFQIPQDLLNDAYPIYDPISNTTRSSIPGLTFQIRPTLSQADPRIPQTPHSAMIVALFDGSVRRLSGGMSENTFWAAVTPNSGEVLGNDWND